MRILHAASTLCLAALAGCADSATFLSPAADAIVAVSGSITGRALGGRAPIVGAHVYLLKASPTGYGQPAQSMLLARDTGHADHVGAYVLSDGDGNYSLPSTYTCSTQDQVYLYASGGNAGSGANSAIGLLAAIGSCPDRATRSTLTFGIDEVTTVGTAYALGGFANDPTHVSMSGSALALTGVENAFRNAPNLYDPAYGTVQQTTPAGNGSVPFQLIHTLSNLLAACIESSGPNSAVCTGLFANSSSAGGQLPADTASAILNIVHHPGANLAALYALAPANSPYAPSLPVPPNDFTVGITYTGAGLNKPSSVAIDAEGNVWAANLGDNTVSKFTSNGTPLSPPQGFTNGSPRGPVGITVDLSGDAWIVNATSASLIKYASSGALLSPSTGYNGGGMGLPQAVTTDALGNVWVSNLISSASKFSNGGLAISSYGYTGGGILSPVGIAVDASGAVWFANTKGGTGSVTRLTSAGQPLSSASGYTGGGVNRPFGIAIDNAGNAFTSNYGGDSISKLAANGDPISPATGYTGGGLSKPYCVAIDGGGNVWAGNSGTFSVSEFSNAGQALSSSTGFQGGLLNGPQAIALDGSGNVWIANANDISLTQLVGASVPVVTPMVYGVKNNLIATRP